MNDLIEDIKMELSILKVENDITDNEITYHIKNTKKEILNITNLSIFPDKLNYVLVKRVVGVILDMLIKSGVLVINNEKLESSQVSSITRGDVSMSYRGTSSFEKFNELINSYTSYGDKEILSFRRIKW